MKKILLIALVVVAGLTSCKKDYTCECTVTSDGTSVTGNTTINDTKKKAEEACENGSSEINGVKTVCKIK